MSFDNFSPLVGPSVQPVGVLVNFFSDDQNDNIIQVRLAGQLKDDATITIFANHSNVDFVQNRQNFVFTPSNMSGGVLFYPLLRGDQPRPQEGYKLFVTCASNDSKFNSKLPQNFLGFYLNGSHTPIRDQLKLDLIERAQASARPARGGKSIDDAGLKKAKRRKRKK
jgi:hypothetical protein